MDNDTTLQFPVTGAVATPQDMKAIASAPRGHVDSLRRRERSSISAISSEH